MSGPGSPFDDMPARPRHVLRAHREKELTMPTATRPNPATTAPQTSGAARWRRHPVWLGLSTVLILGVFTVASAWAAVTLLGSVA